MWKIQIVNGDCPPPELVHRQDDCGVGWAGQPEAINRLVLGYGTRLPDALRDAGVADADILPLLSKIASFTQAGMIYPSMPVQDAIRLASFLVDATKRYVSFVPGADTVGGDTDIAVVTKHEGFKWVRRKHYYPAALNPLETDHV